MKEQNKEAEEYTGPEEIRVDYRLKDGFFKNAKEKERFRQALNRLRMGG